ncbi:MAG: hypothetical protein AAF624_00605 [Bacteroidota bacterium]
MPSDRDFSPGEQHSAQPAERPVLVLPASYANMLASVVALRDRLLAAGFDLPHAFVADQIGRCTQNVCSTLTGKVYSPGTLRLLADFFGHLDAGRIAVPRREGADA